MENDSCFSGFEAPSGLSCSAVSYFYPFSASAAFLGYSTTHLQVAEGFLSCWLGTWVAVFLVLKPAPITWWVEMSDLGLNTKTKEEVSDLTMCPVLRDKYGEKLFAESTC